MWGVSKEGFDLEHFVASVVAPDRRFDYTNLVYACHECNLRKGAANVDDPLQCCTSTSIVLLDSGMLVGMTQEARLLIATDALNSPAMVRWRKLWMRIIELAAQNDPALLEELLGYPVELPNLATLKPPKNAKPEGIKKSHFQRKLDGTLGSTYLH